MTAIRFATSIILGLVASTSAFAAEPEAAPAAAPSPVVSSAAMSALPLTVTLAAGPAAVGYKAAPNARYCFRTERTGSRITPRVCKTRKDWTAMGVDLDAALAGR
ncbi:hypothetical protein ASE90_08445 [Sphingomonas sp. Leaf67]|uniref:hypothetical protein n=1 Tax=Sphingomonas sp. Leaf67 TaxID=1736230 RepID=UPI000700234C|nr:hypothetical protein [Sphingomonas sp. Leaf67]KQN83922.1 hypothetical protein ASE90_08445 [Sphingomonas sp. Leaf67]